MKLSLNWIKEYTKLPESVSIEQLAYDLTMRTVEVESHHDLAADFEGVIIGRIDSIAPHPQADRLRVCQVDTGGGEALSQIVCGGSNLYAGQLVAVAAPGSRVRWHGEGEKVLIKQSVLRGAESAGMICGTDELGLEGLFPASGEHEIMDLTAHPGAKAGMPIADALQLRDVILEIDNKSMTNRPDLWGHYGIARELSVIYGTPLLPFPGFTADPGLPVFPVTIEDAEKCRRYTAAVYDNVHVAPSPYWLKLCLWKVGSRLINNLVDITNYVMLSTGQPIHGFDKDHISGGIIVRPAHVGEKLLLLDGTEIELSPDDLMICDQKGPVALAGVMGGAKDSILPDTRSMILEVANFSALGVRKTVQRHNIRTEASSRFEKAVDQARCDQAATLTHALMAQILPESRLTAYHDCYPSKPASVTVEVSLDYLSTRLGRAVSLKDIREKLEPLGFTVLAQPDQSLRITVPSWRATGDVSLKDDILEETARMIGYENFEYIEPVVQIGKAITQRPARTERAIREALAYRMGFQEIFTYPWVEDKYLEAAGIAAEDCFALSTPPSPTASRLRSSLVPGLLESVSQNLRYYETFRIFEMTQVFKKGTSHPSDETETLPVQPRALAGALVGNNPQLLLLEARGVLESLPVLAQFESYTFERISQPLWADRKAWLNIVLGKEVIGQLGILSLKAARDAGIKHAHTALFEVYADRLSPLPSRENRYHPLPVYPLTQQDLNILVDEDTVWADIESIARAYAAKIEFLEEYRGQNVPQSKKSILFRYWLGKDNGTLTAEEIESVFSRMTQELDKKLGAKVR